LGLTQSFALELAPFRLKVNSVCPGNYYEGRSGVIPENGLFVQYLNAGKVPGAKTIDDSESVLSGTGADAKRLHTRGCYQGVLYLMEQCGETGQALPVTGGQVMLN